MRAQKVLAREFQFYFSDLDNIILVESGEDESVVVRASKNNVSEGRKISFIRKLAAEGFIPDQYQWFSGAADGSNGMLWLKDYSWLKTHQPSRKKANRFMGRLLVATGIFCVAMLRVALVSSDKTASLTQKTPAMMAVSAPQSRFESLVPRKPFAELEGQHQAVTGDHASGNPPLGAAVLKEHRTKNLNQDQSD
jgi:hypothetical protein